MRSGGRIGGNVPVKAMSLILALLMTSGVVLAISPFIGQTAVAPPPVGTLDVTFHDLAPDTHTFPGDENVTMVWLEMTASDKDVQVKSINFTLGGMVDPLEIESVALWDDPSRDQRPEFYECEIDRNPVTGSTFTIPQTGELKECLGTPGSDYVVAQSETRYILVYLSVEATADAGGTIRLTINAIDTDGSTVGGTGTTGTIRVMSIFFADYMESGQGGWTTSGGDGGGMFPDGLWHMSSGEEDCANNILGTRFYHSHDTAWWYGHRWEDPSNPGVFYCSYYTWVPGDFTNRTRNWGELRTPEVDITKGESLFLTFWHVIHGEADTSIYKLDNGHLWLYDGTWHKITPISEGYDTTDSSWWKETVNISAYAGKQIKLEFRFDTQDAMNNVFMGWFVDDVVIYGKTEEHSLAIVSNDLPPVISLPTKGFYPITVSARLVNLGTSVEYDILVNLTVDGIVVNQTMVAQQNDGTSSNMAMGWTPKKEGVHVVCFEATAASGAHAEGCRSTTVISIKPRNLQIYKSANTLMLEWLEPTLLAFQGYRIYQSATVNGFDFMNVYDTAPAGATQWLDPQADAGTDANNYFYILRAFDDQGDEENNTNKVGKFVNQLHVGTNDISVGFELNDNATSAVFESVDGLYESIQAFHAVRCKWLEWTPSGGMLAEVDRSMGLRATMMSEGALVTVGRVVDTAIDLVDTCGGWNFVGYPSFESGSTPALLDDGGMTGMYDVVFEYDPLDRMNPWKFFSSNDTAGSALVDLSSGIGIWMHVNQAGVWEVRGD